MSESDAKPTAPNTQTAFALIPAHGAFRAIYEKTSGVIPVVPFFPAEKLIVVINIAPIFSGSLFHANAVEETHYNPYKSAKIFWENDDNRTIVKIMQQMLTIIDSDTLDELDDNELIIFMDILRQNLLANRIGELVSLNPSASEFGDQFLNLRIYKERDSILTKIYDLQDFGSHFGQITTLINKRKVEVIGPYGVTTRSVAPIEITNEYIFNEVFPGKRVAMIDNTCSDLSWDFNTSQQGRVFASVKPRYGKEKEKSEEYLEAAKKAKPRLYEDWSLHLKVVLSAEPISSAEPVSSAEDVLSNQGLNAPVKKGVDYIKKRKREGGANKRRTRKRRNKKSNKKKNKRRTRK
jgi:hypothetical protein